MLSSGRGAAAGFDRPLAVDRPVAAVRAGVLAGFLLADAFAAGLAGDLAGTFAATSCTTAFSSSAAAILRHGVCFHPAFGLPLGEAGQRANGGGQIEKLRPARRRGVGCGIADTVRRFTTRSTPGVPSAMLTAVAMCSVTHRARQPDRAFLGLHAHAVAGQRPGSP